MKKSKRGTVTTKKCVDCNRKKGKCACPGGGKFKKKASN